MTRATRKPSSTAYVKRVVADVLPADAVDETVYHINPTGSFEIGGPDGDAGLTGRKIIVDTYGGAAPHGGGAFSGKDPTKVDRSAAYARATSPRTSSPPASPRAARSSSPTRSACREPLSLYVDTHGTGTVGDDRSSRRSADRAARRPDPARHPHPLGLNKPIYAPTAAYGHFGRKAEGDLFPWEKTDL
jgi:S-adenosylmethionine synthetase